MINQEMEMKAREHDVSDVSGETVAKVITAAAAEEVTTGYKKIEDAKARLSGKDKKQTF